MSFYKPWTGLAHAYPVATDLKSAREGFKRCRNIQHFILKGKSVENGKLTCVCCGKPITEESGNRCVYIPKTKQIIIRDYHCAITGAIQSVYDNAHLYGY